MQRMTDEQRKAAWENILKAAQDQHLDTSHQSQETITNDSPSVCQRLVTVSPATKMGFFAGGIIASICTGGISAVVQGALWGAVGARTLEFGKTKLSETCQRSRTLRKR